jgi:CRISPR system Cascade subunit CasA
MQMPAIRKAKRKSPGALLPHIATGNNTILQDLQKERPLHDAACARLVLVLCGYAFGGKRVDNSVCLTPGYQGKSKSGKPGPWLGFLGYLHHFLHADDLLRLAWLNMLTEDDLDALPELDGVGVAPWESMPEGEDGPRVRALRDSLMGRLTPLSRFVLLDGDAIHNSEGIAYPGYKEGWLDPSVATNFAGKEKKALWADPAKLPWRNLASLLAFMRLEQGMEAFGVAKAMQRAIRSENRIDLWVGGIRVSSNAGEQYVAGTNDFVESLYGFTAEKCNAHWSACLNEETEHLTYCEKVLYASVQGYARELKAEGDGLAATATGRFWELCNHEAQTLLDVCDTEDMKQLRKRYRFFVEDAYNGVCPRETARQLAAWGKCRPRLKT